MSIPFNPLSLAMIPDPSLGFDHTRRIVMDPPASFLASAAAQNAIAAGQVAPPQANGPIAFNSDGQAVLMSPAGAPASGAISGAGVSGSSAMGMGVSTPNQQGLDPAVMSAIQQQLANGPSPDSHAAAAPAASNTLANSAASQVPVSVSAALTPMPSGSAAPTGTAAISGISSALSSANSASATTTASLDPAAAATSSASAASSSRPFVGSAAFILLIIFSALIFFGVIATALSWLLRWKGKNGSRSFFGAGCFGPRKNGRRDLESDDLSDIIRNFESRRGSYGTTMSEANSYASAVPRERNEYDAEMEKRSSLLAEEMGRAPFLHSGLNCGSAIGVGVGLDGNDGMEEVDLNDEKSVTGTLPRMPAATMGQDLDDHMGSPRMLDHFATGRLEVRNGDNVASGFARTVPAQRSWSAERGLSNLGAGWMSNKSNSSPPSSGSSLPSPFSSRQSLPDDVHIASNGFGSSSSSASVSRSHTVKSAGRWDRSASHMTDMSLSEGNADAESPFRSSSWASNLRSSLLAAISAPKSAPLPDEDRFTRPVLPVHLSRSSTHRSSLLSRSSTGASSRVEHLPGDATFGRAGGRGLVITEEEDNERDEVYSLASSTKRDMEAALLCAGTSRSASPASETDSAAPAPNEKRSLLNAERWRLYAKGSKGGRDAVDALPSAHSGQMV